jgi:hypothetical protein
MTEVAMHVLKVVALFAGVGPRLCRLAILLALAMASQAWAQAGGSIYGTVRDSSGAVIPGATLKLTRTTLQTVYGTVSDQKGFYSFSDIPGGRYDLAITASGFTVERKSGLGVNANSALQVDGRLAVAIQQDTVTITADINDLDVLSPDPAEKVFVRQDLLDANPGRPGAPVSIPGYPIETASGGIKAPQYFAPGIAGDHGEPIAQYLAVGTYLLPNNLSANAHGNGYADPNVFIPEILESVQVDGGAYNVREGNHALNLAAIYGLRASVDPFATLTGDYRDLDLVAGVSPTARSFVAIEASYGNGFLKRLEHRQQYKLNSQRILQLGNHELTVLGVGYYGSSYVAGLVPIFAPSGSYSNVTNVGDTIDPRQRDQTHSAFAAFNDNWRITSSQQLYLSGFLRTYNLSLFSDFGQGLIRQSEFRTVAGQSTNYENKLGETFSVLAGLDYERDAPRRDNLDHYGFYAPGTQAYGPFTKVGSNNVTLTTVAPYAAGSGALGHYFRYYAGWRRDQIEVRNEDLIHSENSFQKWVGLNSPKATLSFIPQGSRFLPILSGSFGGAFFTEDPRMGIGSTVGTAVATAHSYQLVISKGIEKTDLRITLVHVTTSDELAKIDPDTGLQVDQGPGRLKFMAVSARRNFGQGSILVTFSKADAREIDSGGPTPEAPRTIFDLLGTVQKLPFHLEGRGEFEYVGRKPLGNGCQPDSNALCVGVPVREFRAALVRPFLNGRLNVGLNMLLARGFTGQTLESFAPSMTNEVVGVRIPSFASVNVTYRFGGHQAFSR